MRAQARQYVCQRVSAGFACTRQALPLAASWERAAASCVRARFLRHLIKPTRSSAAAQHCAHVSQIVSAPAQHCTHTHTLASQTVRARALHTRRPNGNQTNGMRRSKCSRSALHTRQSNGALSAAHTSAPLKWYAHPLSARHTPAKWKGKHTCTSAATSAAQTPATWQASSPGLHARESMRQALRTR